MRAPRLPTAASVLLASLLALAGCVVDEEPDAERTQAEPAATTERPAESVTIEAAAPYGVGEEITAERLEAERFDRSWEEYARENLAARRARSGVTAEPDPARSEDEAGRQTDAPPSTAAAAGNPFLTRMREGGEEGTAPAGSGPDGSAAEAEPTSEDEGGAPEAWEDITPEALQGGEASFPVASEGGGPTALRVQWLLDRVGFSPGVLDGRWGKNTEKAVYWLQDSLGIEPTGRIDRALYDRLAAAVDESSPVRQYTVSAQDLEGPFTEVPDDPEAQAELECLCYASPQELLAEKFHTTGELLAQLNPEVDLANVQQGTRLWVPAVDVLEPGNPGEAGSRAADSEVARVVISKGGFYIHALDEAGDVLYHFPSTMGSKYNPSPEGSYEVDGVGWRPDFHYQPELLSSPDEEQQVEDDVLLPPGPNSPVGLVWMQLSKPHYGIHGTARPETIGYTTSHGCIRMTNWDAVFLGHRVAPGTPVEFRP